MLDAAQHGSGFPLVEIGAVVDAVRTTNPAVTTPDDEFIFVNLSAVDQDTKAITAPHRLLGSDAPSRARQVLKRGDVLVSTVRPNLNGVAIVSPDVDGAIGSTGFCVLRPAEGRLDSRYLYHWVRTPAFVEDMVRQATGASYPAVTDGTVRRSRIPAPPLGEQRRIAAILDEADALRAKRRAALAQLDEMAQAIFVEMFGDVRTNSRQWPMHPVAAFVAEFQGGKSLESDPDNDDAAYRVLKISAVTSGIFRAEENKPMPDGYEPPAEHFVRNGDLLFSRANTTELVGAVALVDDPPANLVLPDKLWRFVWRKPHLVDPLFVQALFQHPATREEIGRRATGTSGSMKNISQAKLLAMPAILPPLDLQLRFAERIACVQQSRRDHQQAAALTKSFFASLQQRAFQGEL